MMAAVRQAGLLLGLAVFLGIGSSLLRPAGLPLVGDWSGGPAHRAGIDTISLAEAAALHEKGTGLFLDARPAADYAAGHIARALHLPPAEAEAQFVDLFEQLVAAETVVAYCDGESCTLSHELAGFLQELEIAEVKVLLNGWTLWHEAGLPWATRE
jgi:rhodanese-related sulfurtransferase